MFALSHTGIHTQKDGFAWDTSKEHNNPWSALFVCWSTDDIDLYQLHRYIRKLKQQTVLFIIKTDFFFFYSYSTIQKCFSAWILHLKKLIPFPDATNTFNVVSLSDTPIHRPAQRLTSYTLPTGSITDLQIHGQLLTKWGKQSAMFSSSSQLLGKNEFSVGKTPCCVTGVLPSRGKRYSPFTVFLFVRNYLMD